MAAAHEMIASLIEGDIAQSIPPAAHASAPKPDIDAEGDRATARNFGFSVDNMNEEWAFVLMGSKAVMVREMPDAPVEDRVRVLALESFRAKYLNKFTEIVASDGKIKITTWATAWLSNRNRRDFDGIEFFPSSSGEPGTPGYLNLWRGFSVEPRAGGSYAIFRDHLLNNVCNGDEILYRWLFGWFAHMVQRPRDRAGTALVFRGLMGTGKTKIGEVFGSLMQSHYFMVDDPRYIVGQFNAHMASCLLLQAEEAVWARDKAAEGRLKGLVTSDTQMIEAKGVDSIRLKNYVRLVMTSNEDWVVPAGKDERRFCVLDINPRCAKNYGYFKEMDAELDNGGREALLHDLLNFDLSAINPREIPKTGALLEQKLRSLDSVESWWFERLMSGQTVRNELDWLPEISVARLFGDYIHQSDQIGVRRKSEMTAFGMKLRKLVPAIKRVRATYFDGEEQQPRSWGYHLPELAACREAFEDAVGQSVDWDETGA